MRAGKALRLPLMRRKKLNRERRRERRFSKEVRWDREKRRRPREKRVVM